MEKAQTTLSENLVASKIYFIRDKRVMLDRDLAELYEVETKVLNQAVRRNIERFPGAFLFQLTPAEFGILKSQIVTSSWGGSRKLPYAFTELCKDLHNEKVFLCYIRSKKSRDVDESKYTKKPGEIFVAGTQDFA